MYKSVLVGKIKDLIQKGKVAKVHEILPFTAEEHMLIQRNKIDAHNP